MDVIKGTFYRIKGSHAYFMHWFGSYNPEILITHRDSEIYKNGWYYETNCSPCIMLATRLNRLKYPDGYVKDGVWMGVIQGKQVLVIEEELEEI